MLRCIRTTRTFYLIMHRQSAKCRACESGMSISFLILLVIVLFAQGVEVDVVVIVIIFA
jgi:hypothetical protein